MKLLFVDDSADDVELACAELRREGLEFKEHMISRLEELDSALGRESWSAIISDYDLQTYTGLDVVRAVRLRDRDVPLILYSGLIGEERAVEIIREGATDYVTKDHRGRLAVSLRREIVAAEARAERQRLEASLREAEDRYRRTFHEAPIGIVQVDRSMRIIALNRRFCEIVRYEAAHLIGRPIAELVHPEDVTQTHELQADLLVRGGVRRLDRRYIRKDGSLAWTHVKVSAMRNDSGQIDSILGLVEDITEARAAREKMRMQARLLDCVQQAVIATDIQGIVTYWNHIAESMYGWKAEEVLGRPIDTILVSSEMVEHSAEVMARLRAGQSWRGEMMSTRRDGSTFPAYFIDSPIFDEEGQIIGIVGVSQDVTEQKRMARQRNAIAKLGRMILSSLDAHAFDHACEVLMWGAGSDFAFISELTPAATLKRRAGMMWSDDVPAEIQLSAATQMGAAILTRQPVVVDDYRTDERFNARDLTVPYGVLSGAMVPIAIETRQFGVLAVLSRRAGQFRDQHIDFLQTAANMIAEAMERELAFDVIAESEQRYHRIYDGASEIIFTLGAEGQIAGANPAFETITDWRIEDWIGRSFHELIAPSDRDRFTRLYENMVVNHQPVTAGFTLTGRDREVMVDIASFPKIEGGRVAEIYGFARDVTEARRAQLERERVTRNVQLLLESTIEGIFALDLQGCCTLANRATATFLGRRPEEIIGQPIHDLIHSDVDEKSCAILQVARDATARTVTSDFFRRADGTRTPVSYSAAPILDDGVLVGLVVTFTDLTERRLLEAKLEQANRVASLGRLAATVAHEFNNVLMGISPFVEVIRHGSTSDTTCAALDHITRSVKRGRRVTEDILRFTQPAEPLLAAIELRSWLTALAAEARSILPSSYSIDVSAEHLHVFADANQLHQIFLNLILNARDAMPRGGTIAVTARRETADARFAFGTVVDPSRYAHISIADTGCGMSEETLRHAFEPLFTTKKTGTGLGLAVTHQVVSRHDGEIFAESVPDAGTTFHIFLPLAEAAKTHSSAAGASASPLAAKAREILLVEDDVSVATGLRILLEAEGFSVRTASTGRSALENLRLSRPDAVLLDVGLPDIDGTAVFVEIAATHPSLPVIFSTGHADRGRLERHLTRPNVTFLLKPYDSQTLFEALSSVMS